MRALHATPGAKIYCTTNGSTPTTSSTLYAGPLSVGVTTPSRPSPWRPGTPTAPSWPRPTRSRPLLTSIAVTAPSTIINAGTSEQCVATGSYTDGVKRDVTGQVTWTSADSNVATVSAAGLLTAVGGGTASVTATRGPITGGMTVTVRAQYATYYCYDIEGRLTAQLACPLGQSCATSCPR